MPSNVCAFALCSIYRCVCGCEHMWVCMCVRADAIRSDMCEVIGSRVCDARGNHGSIWRMARDRTHLVMPTEPRRTWKAFSVCVRHFPVSRAPCQEKKNSVRVRPRVRESERLRYEPSMHHACVVKIRHAQPIIKFCGS